MSDEVHRVPIEMPAPRPRPEGPCLHNGENEVEARLVYLEDSHHYTLDLRARCVACGTPFRFEALPHAVAITKPCRDLSGMTATLPVVPDPSLRELYESELTRWRRGE